MAFGQEHQSCHWFPGWFGQPSDADFRAEVEKILNQMEEGVESPGPRFCSKWARWCASRKVRFADFNGNVEEVNYEKSKVRVGHHFLVARRPSNFDFSQVEKT